MYAPPDDRKESPSTAILWVLFVAGAGSLVFALFLFASARSADEGIGGILFLLIGAALLVLDFILFAAHRRRSASGGRR
jgi:hypothetical protein